MPTSKSRNSLLNAPDYADRVNLIMKIKVDGAWRFAPVVPEPDGRLKDKVAKRERRQCAVQFALSHAVLHL